MNSVNTIFSFHNILPNLQCVAGNLVFFACHFSISYRVSNLIGSVLRTNNKVNGLSLDYFSVCVCYMIQKKNTTYGFNIMKKERKKWNNKNRFQDKTMCLLQYIVYCITRTMNYHPISLANGSRVFVLVGVMFNICRKKKK